MQYTYSAYHTVYPLCLLLCISAVYYLYLSSVAGIVLDSLFIVHIIKLRLQLFLVLREFVSEDVDIVANLFGRGVFIVRITIFFSFIAVLTLSFLLQ